MKPPLSWFGILRLGFVQACLGACVVLATSTINRVMVVELALPAVIPGALVGLHYAIQALRPRWGYGSDAGGRLTPWIIGGMAILGGGGIGAACAVPLMQASFATGLITALISFTAIGIGVGASGTSLLVLIARRVEDARRPAAATVTWITMILGFIATAALVSRFLDPFSMTRLVEVAVCINVAAVIITVIAVAGIEDIRVASATPASASTKSGFRSALRETWQDRQVRTFAIFVFVSMMAYSAEELLLEPFAGKVFGLAAGATAKLQGLQHGGVLVGMIIVAVLSTGLPRPFGNLRHWSIGGCIASAAAMLGLSAVARGGPDWPLSATVFALGLANGVFAVAAIGSMMRLVGRGAKSREGTRMGVWGAAQGVAFGAGGFVGPAAADLGRWVFADASSAYAAVFALEAILFLGAAALALRIRERDVDVLAATPAKIDGTGTTLDVVVVGGGPAGATAAADLAQAGRSVQLMDRAGRIKPCGGAIPPRLVRDFDIPAQQIVARVTSARMIAPSNIGVDMPIDDGFVGMVDREHFDEFLRERACETGAQRVTATFDTLTRDSDGCLRVHSRDKAGGLFSVRARIVVGADGTNSAVARTAMPDAPHPPFVFAYHEIVRAPAEWIASYDPRRCDVVYQGVISPDFYGWVFPHGQTMSIGTGSANKGFSLRGAVTKLRVSTGLDGYETIRREGAPIPMKPRKRWDNGRDVLLIGDCAGAVAPASGEGIYYAMLSGRLGAEAINQALSANLPAKLRGARKAFMKAHGRVFFILGVLQWIWYRSDKRREQFVALCRNPDVQSLTWDAYMNKEMVRGKKTAHLRVMIDDMRHLLGFGRA